MEQIDATSIKVPHTGDDWLKVLDECDVRFAVLDRSQDGELIDTLRHQPEWSVVGSENDGAMIFARSVQGER